MDLSLVNSSAGRRTAADELFEQIRSDINKMRLVPGTKITEAEVAKRYDVSRQPVREAFIRLDNLSLLQIRPQKATVVRPISKSDIRRARFVRTSVEIEVARIACSVKSTEFVDEMQLILDKQAECLKDKDLSGFNALDSQFHKRICLMAKCEFATEVINSCKAKVDRLCMLSLANEKDAEEVYNDHVTILKHLIKKDEKKLVQSIRDHLSRLDSTIEMVQAEHSSYFEE